TMGARSAPMEQQEAVKQERRGGLLSRLPFRPSDTGPADSFEGLIRAVKASNAKADVRDLQRAYQFASDAHEGQKRLTGEDFVEHPVAVATVLADLGLGGATLQAALLHDTVEDTPITAADIREQFGDEVAMLVEGLTKLDRIRFRSREQEQAENTRKMMVAMARDPRVLLIKLADRLHNMRTLSVFSRQKQQEKATETLEIYSPLAARLGMYRLKMELDDLSFQALHPKRFEEIQSLVEKRNDERHDYVDVVIQHLNQKLKELKIKADVRGRPKHLYSIYEKMVLRGKEFNEIYDLVGLRVLVDSVRDCYAVLGALHALWKPVPGRFKDYIAMPKFNMYQSLHTTVIGPEGRPLEVQIRTHQMHDTAEDGIAAHWRYKASAAGKKGDDRDDLAWLGRMLEWQQESGDPRDFMEGLKIDLYENRVFAFTPKGDVVDLPAGSTPLDFAYAIHTDVGHRCVGARIGGRLVPLDYKLQTGEAVEILTSKAPDAAPKRDWLLMVKSPRARNKIRQWFSRERREDAMETGRDLLQRELRRQSLPVVRLSSDETMSHIAADLKYPNLESLYVAIGEGHVSPQSIVTRLSRLVSDTVEEEPEEIPPARPVHLGGDGKQPVVVQGRSDVWVKLARCCTPVPGDEISGFVTRGHGVSVHRSDCPNMRALVATGPERLIEVSWAAGKPTSFMVSIQVEALDRQKLLRDVANVLADQRVNIVNASTHTGRDRIATLRFTFELADATHLSSILSAVKRIEGVFDAYRVVPT
ncbi:MAG: bifunctional (p)ppGpp synthetase/guanosine-3',5'-bis(diphosphate) 3'-pyrophosphohydrolase, partial [Actinomycetota bacterium]